MTPERLAEFRTFALEAIPQVAQLSDESESARVIISTCGSGILGLIDALTAMRERAEKAEAQCDVLVKLLQKARKA